MLPPLKQTARKVVQLGWGTLNINNGWSRVGRRIVGVISMFFCSRCRESPRRLRLLARYVNVVRSRLRMIGDYIRGVPEGRPTNHVLGSIEAWSSIESESWMCCWF